MINNNMKTLVLYVFHEVTDLVNNFFKNALFESDSVDFFIICNNISTEFTLPYEWKNLYCLQRANIGYDFAGWSEALLTNDFYKSYTHFIFVNSSVVGPYLPRYYKGRWTDVYLDGLKDNVKLFGSTINCSKDELIDINKYCHVQSYIFSLEINTLQYLIDEEIFTMKNENFNFADTVYNKEIKMSRLIIEKGWNIGCLYSYYKDIDFTFQTTNRPIKFLGDIMYPRFYNVYWTLYELVFVKGNRVKLL